MALLKGCLLYTHQTRSILMGANVTKTLVPPRAINCQDEGPYAVQTHLSWTINGPAERASHPPTQPGLLSVGLQWKTRTLLWGQEILAVEATSSPVLQVRKLWSGRVRLQSCCLLFKMSSCFYLFILLCLRRDQRSFSDTRHNEVALIHQSFQLRCERCFVDSGLDRNSGSLDIFFFF